MRERDTEVSIYLSIYIIYNDDDDDCWYNWLDDKTVYNIDETKKNSKSN